MKQPFLLLLALSIAMVSCNPTNDTSQQQTEKPSVKINQPTERKLVEKWSLAGFEHPESVLYYEAEDVLFVSNIKDHPMALDSNGYISKVSLDGKLIEQYWATGLDAPKGMGIVDSVLYVTDMLVLRAISLANGEILETYPVEGAKFLNDIATDNAGTVFFTESFDHKIFTLEDNMVNLWLYDTLKFTHPNGLYDRASDMLLATTTNDAGALLRISKSDQSVDTLATGMGHGDGIVQTNKGFIVSSWKGEIFHLDDRWNVTLLLDGRDEKINAADIEYVASENMLVVPTFFDNRIVAYEVIE